MQCAEVFLRSTSALHGGAETSQVVHLLTFEGALLGTEADNKALKVISKALSKALSKAKDIKRSEDIKQS